MSHRPIKGIKTAFFSALLLAITLMNGCNLFGAAEGKAEPISNPNADHLVTPELLAHVSQEVEKYRIQVETLRNLPFLKPVSSTVVTRDFYQSQTSQEIDEGLSDSLSQEISLELSQLGFFPDTSLKYKDLFKSFSGGFAVGYYQRGSDSVFVLADYAYDEINLREILTHELAHALQDQYDRLNRPPIADSSLLAYQYDAEWYHTCLVEGEAHFLNALAAATYIYPQPDPTANALLAESNIRAGAFSKWKKTERPDNLFLPSHAAYQFGPALIADAYFAKGWDSIETLYENSMRPSYSAITSQIEPWIAIDFQPWTTLMDTTNAFSDMGSHGSIGLLALVNQEMDSSDFYSGLGWRGDTYFFNHPKQKRWGQLIWCGIFEDQGHALRARELLKSMLSKRFQGGNYPETTITGDSLILSLPGTLLKGLGLTTYIIQKENRLFWVEGFTDTESQEAISLLQIESELNSGLALRGLRQIRPTFKPYFVQGSGRIYQHLLSLSH